MVTGKVVWPEEATVDRTKRYGVEASPNGQKKWEAIESYRFKWTAISQAAEYARNSRFNVYRVVDTKAV